MQDPVSEYPQYEVIGNGIRVRVSKGAYLPGIFLGMLHAERAWNLYNNKVKNAKPKKDK